MNTMEILKLLAADDALARPSLTGPEWHEIVSGDGQTVPLSAANFDHLRDAGLVIARDEGSFVISGEGRRHLERGST